jgi:hypothetical protein
LEIVPHHASPAELRRDSDLCNNAHRGYPLDSAIARDFRHSGGVSPTPIFSVAAYWGLVEATFLCCNHLSMLNF